MANNVLQVEGLGINPFLFELDSEPSAVINKTIHLTNTTNDSLSFVVSINDFVPNGRTGQALFLDTEKESDPKFSLSKWITITKQPSFTIPAHGSTDIQFAISPPADAEPGTHFGGILFSRPSIGDQQNSATAVQQKVGAIILVKLGKSQENVHSISFTTNKKVYKQDLVNFDIVLANEGNVHSKPKGDISIKNIFGKVISQVPVNRDASIILPQSQREFTASWDPHLSFGYFTADEILYYGNPKLEVHAQTGFWILPVKEVLYGVPILLILGIILYVGISRYNRYIIKRSLNKTK